MLGTDEEERFLCPHSSAYLMLNDNNLKSVDPKPSSRKKLGLPISGLTLGICDAGKGQLFISGNSVDVIKQEETVEAAIRIETGLLSPWRQAGPVAELARVSVGHFMA